MNKYLNVFFFFALFIVAIQSKTRNSQSDMEIVRIIKASTLYFALDDEVTGIFINGEKVDFSFSCYEAKQANFLHTQKLLLLPGDELKVVGKDIYNEQSYFVGSLHFRDPQGKTHIYNTNSQWICEGKPAVELQKRIESGLPYPKIETDAYLIWDSTKVVPNKEISCVFKIPCQ